LKPASNLLDDVEGFFLAPEVLRHPPRNEQQMAEWLGHAVSNPKPGRQIGHTMASVGFAYRFLGIYYALDHGEHKVEAVFV